MIFFHMVVAVILLCEAFSTCIAIKSASFMYDHHVLFIRIFSGKSSPALLTEIIIFPGVILHMTSEMSFLNEFLLTKSAGKLPILFGLEKGMYSITNNAQCTENRP